MVLARRECSLLVEIHAVRRRIVAELVLLPVALALALESVSEEPFFCIERQQAVTQLLVAGCLIGWRLNSALSALESIARGASGSRVRNTAVLYIAWSSAMIALSASPQTSESPGMMVALGCECKPGCGEAHCPPREPCSRLRLYFWLGPSSLARVKEVDLHEAAHRARLRGRRLQRLDEAKQQR